MGLFICLRLLNYVIYTIFYGTLTLFLIHQIGLSESTALLLAGGFIGLNYGCSILGGTLLEWVHDLRIPLVLGVFLHYLGTLLFFKYGMVLIGLSVFILGSLTFDSSFFLALTRLYQAQLSLLQKAFYLNYLGMNIGGIIGFTLGGFMQQSDSVHFIIIANLLVLILSLLLLLCRWKFLALLKEFSTQNHFTRIYQVTLYPLLLLTAFVLIFNLLKFQAWVSIMVIGLWILAYLITWILLFAYKKIKTNPGYARFLILSLAYLLFWSIYFLIPTLMTLFLNYNVNLTFYRFVFSPAWFINIMCLVVIIGVLTTLPVFKTKALNIDRHFAYGFILQILALLILITGLLFAGSHKVSLLWAIIYFVVQALAELALAPIASSSVGQLIAKRFQPFFMGFWLSTSGVAVMIASKIAQHVVGQLQANLVDNIVYLHLFIILTLVSALGLVLLALKHYVLQ